MRVAGDSVFVAPATHFGMLNHPFSRRVFVLLRFYDPAYVVTSARVFPRLDIEARQSASEIHCVCSHNTPPPSQWSCCLPRYHDSACHSGSSVDPESNGLPGGHSGIVCSDWL